MAKKENIHGLPPGTIAAKFAELFNVRFVDITPSEPGSLFHQLYHRTTPEAALVIVAEGFRDPESGEDGGPVGVWLSGALDCMGEKGRTLLRVDLDVSVGLGDFRQQVEMHVLGPDVEGVESGENWIDDPDEESVCWYCVPAAIVNANSRVRIVPREEEDLIDLD